MFILLCFILTTYIKGDPLEYSIPILCVAQILSGLLDSCAQKSMVQQCPARAWCCFGPILVVEKVPDCGPGMGLGAGEVEEVKVLEEGRVYCDGLETSD